MARHLEHDWHPAPLPANVTMGPGAWIYSSYAFQHFHSRRRDAVSIGAHCGVYLGSFFNLGPQGRVKIGEYSAIVAAIISTNGEVEIGSHAFIAHQVVIADQDFATPANLRPRKDRRASPAIRIGRNVWIGARAVILGGADIGDDAVIGAAAVVRDVVPPRAIVGGDPARVIGSV